MEGNTIQEATLIFNGVKYHHGEKTIIQAESYSLSVGSVPIGYKLNNWIISGEISIEDHPQIF